MEVNSLRSWELKWTIPYRQTASQAIVQPACWLYSQRIALNSHFYFHFYFRNFSELLIINYEL